MLLYLIMKSTWNDSSYGKLDVVLKLSRSTNSRVSTFCEMIFPSHMQIPYCVETMRYAQISIQLFFV